MCASMGEGMNEENIGLTYMHDYVLCFMFLLCDILCCFYTLQYVLICIFMQGFLVK